MLKKLKEKIFNKKILIYFLAFIIPIIILVGYVLYNQIMTDRDFFMNGENYLTADMGGQYNALYHYIRNVFLGKDSIFYSFHNSLGGNMASTIGYYLASPFNFLYIFVSKSNIPLMTYIIYVLKISLCSLFMNIYISHKFGNRYSNLIFSLTYAFMGFVVVYFFNSMWLDVIYMTPLVILGIDKLIDGKLLMYIITLFLSIIFNFYIAYMLSIFCVIYFIYELFTRYSIKDFKSYKKIILRFIISSLLAGGLSAFFLIPVLLDLRNSMRTLTDKSELVFSFNYFLKRLLNIVFSKTLIGSNNKASILGRLRPVIYVSLFCLVLSYLYFFNKKIKIKERVLSLLIIIFFVMSFMIPHLQYMWHGFSLPNGYIDRYSFLFCFFLILLAAKCFYNRSHIKIIWFILYLIVYLFLTYKLYYLKLSFLDKSNYIITLVFIFIYLLLIFVYFNVKTKNPKDIIFLVFIIVIIELIYNYSQSIVLIKKSDYGKYYKNSCREFNSIEDSFYRVDGSYLGSSLNSFYCDYYGLGTALSTSNSNLYNFYYNHGGSVTSISLFDDCEVLPILNSILGIKYIINITKIDGVNYEFLKKIDSDNFFGYEKYAYIYKNNDAVNLGFIIDNNFESRYKYKKGNSLSNLNNFIKSLSGIDEDVLIKIEKEKLEEKNSYSYYIDSNKEYIYLATNYEISMNFGKRYEVYIDDKYTFSSMDVYVGTKKIKNEYYDKNIVLRLLEFSDYKINDFDIYYFDKTIYKKIIDKLKQYQLENIVVKGNTITGEIELDKAATMFVSIPYDKGWNVYVDGVKVSYKRIADAFIGIDLNSGKHKITMKYYPKGLLIGIFISFISFELIVILHTVFKQ